AHSRTTCDCALIPQTTCKIWIQELSKRGLNINVSKTKVMTTVEGNGMKIVSKGARIEQVESFKYLGVVVQGDGTTEEEINEILMNASRLYHTMNTSFLRKKMTSRKTKMTVYRTVFRPILIFGSESWVLTNRQKSKLQVIDMKYLRAVKGVTRKDKIRNEVIREELSGICTTKD
ncbi:unnamed protein product, partial [Acanthoscelides obtectus]